MTQPFHNHSSFTIWTKGQGGLVAYKKWYTSDQKVEQLATIADLK